MISRESRKQNWSCQKDSTWKCTDFCVSFGSWDSLIVNIFLKELLVFIVDVQCNLKIECRVERNGTLHLNLLDSEEIHTYCAPTWILKSSTFHLPNSPFKYSLSSTLVSGSVNDLLPLQLPRNISAPGPCPSLFPKPRHLWILKYTFNLSANLPYPNSRSSCHLLPPGCLQ